jgi:hypothetical protein
MRKEVNRNPKPNEYIYLLDMVWTNGEIGHLPFKYGSLVKDVKLTESGYEFTCCETENRYRTNYSWAFAENTPLNRIAIDNYLKAQNKFEAAKKNLKFFRSKIIGLNTSEEEERDLRIDQIL